MRSNSQNETSYIGLSHQLGFLLTNQYYSSAIFILFIDFQDRENGGGRERESSMCCSTHLCIHWFLLVCALTGDQTHNLGILRGHSNQLSYPARATHQFFIRTPTFCRQSYQQRTKPGGTSTRKILFSLLNSVQFLQWLAQVPHLIRC